MVSSLSQNVNNNKIGFSVFDQISNSDSSLPFGNVLSADRIREIFGSRLVFAQDTRYRHEKNVGIILDTTFFELIENNTNASIKEPSRIKC